MNTRTAIIAAFYVAAALTLTAMTTQYMLRSLSWPVGMPSVWAPEERDRWSTGDAMVFWSTKGDSIAINMASGDAATHVGILVKMEDVWMLWHADAPDTRGDLVLDTRHSGVQLVALDYYLRTSPGLAMRVARPTNANITVPDDETLSLQILQTCHAALKHGFEPSLPRLFAVAASSKPKHTWVPWPRTQDSIERPWFCSSFTAHVYRSWGWNLNGAKTVDAFHPKHFLFVRK